MLIKILRKFFWVIEVVRGVQFLEVVSLPKYIVFTIKKNTSDSFQINIIRTINVITYEKGLHVLNIDVTS